MSNKINGLENRPVQVSPGSAARPVSDREGAPRTDVPGPARHIHITDTARTLASLEESMKKMPAVDEKKVTLVRDSLRDGNYKIDPQRVADKLLRMEQELSGGKRNSQ
ncbi:MAG: flagellar biosynthesis anti-sigma factor FlgM [Steroidobacteraceae bacterium]